jgi:hypothetical protein
MLVQEVEQDGELHRISRELVEVWPGYLGPVGGPQRTAGVSEPTVEPPLAGDMTSARKHSMVASAAARFFVLFWDSVSLSSTS